MIMFCDEYNEFINASKNRAKSILALFFDRLAYHDLFNHLFDIKIYIDYNNTITYDNSCAVYNHDTNIIDDKLSASEEKKLELVNSMQYHSIWINYDYFKALFNEYINSSISRKEAAILGLSETIIHEIIHENRTILRKYDNTLNNLDYIYASYEKSKTINSNYLSLLRYETDKLISNGLVGEILISSSRGNKNYDIYYDTIVKLYIIKDLEGNIIEQIDDAIIYGYDDEVYLSSSFYNKNNLSNIIYDNKDDVRNKIINQRAIEEALTEALTNMIFNSSFYDKFDLEEESTTIINDKNIRLEVKAACYIFNTFGYEFLNWFILSCYEEEYKDAISDIFKEDTMRVLEIFNYLYYSKNDRKYISEYYELLNIIKHAQKSKKLI